jgi:hypothetical protein
MIYFNTEFNVEDGTFPVLFEDEDGIELRWYKWVKTI